MAVSLYIYLNQCTHKPQVLKKVRSVLIKGSPYIPIDILQMYKLQNFQIKFDFRLRQATEYIMLGHIL